VFTRGAVGGPQRQHQGRRSQGIAGEEVWGKKSIAAGLRARGSPMQTPIFDCSTKAARRNAVV
jgi:hypothetical protein